MMGLRAARRFVAVVGCVGLLVCVVGVGSAGASEGLSSWWGVSVGERPTSLRAGASSLVLELDVSATGGEFALLETARFNPPVGLRLLAWDASASAVQKAIEEMYPQDAVEVSGGPGDGLGSKPYVITFPGQAICPPSQPVSAPGACVEPLAASGEFPAFFGGIALSGGKAEAVLTEVSGGSADHHSSGDGQVVIDAENRGDTGTNGSTDTVVGRLPAGLKAVAIEGAAGGAAGTPTERGPVKCSLKTLTCSFEAFERENGKGVLEVVQPVLPAYEQIEVRISVMVQPGASSGERTAGMVSGGGAPRAVTVEHSIDVGGGERFGLEGYEVLPESAGGLIDTQAGSHPFQITNIDTFNSTTPNREGLPQSVGLTKDVVAELPAGFIGNPTPFAQCTDLQFATQLGDKTHTANECPADSAIGVATLTFNEPQSVKFDTFSAPIFNMKPLAGEPARFGFKVDGIVPAFLDTSVRTGSDYGVTITSSNIPEVASLLSVKLTFWGVPGDARHDHDRGWECLESFGTCPTSSSTTPPPFLVMPTGCSTPFQSTVHADSWGSSAKPAEQAEPLTYTLPETIDGCDRLPFDPSISVAPDDKSASTPTGLTVDVHIPQTAALNPEGLAESTLKDTTVTLPAGLALNPAGADGLEACSESQIGYLGSGGEGAKLFTPGQPSCPDASKVATVKIKTPLLPNALEGEVYLAAQNANPFGSLVAMYLVAEDPVSGTLVKLAGEVKLDATTGQLVSSFDHSPELPFEDLELHFFGGERAPLATPPRCGAYPTGAAFAPWSGNPAASASSFFNITSGPHGNACPGPALPFEPSLAGGSTNIQAGAFTPLTTTIGREDGQQNLQSVQLHMPEGLSGMLSSVALCGEEQANTGTCGPASLIGETTVSVGLGGSPFSVTGGKVYLTGPYQGAPFGLSIVNPAVAGPYNLGQVIVRAKIEVDPHTTALTITTNPTGPYAIPQILDGIPLQIKHVNVTINRPGFTFNPTNCNPTAITGTLASTEGASTALSIPFQITNCAALKFTPKFVVTTSGKTSKTYGASLTAKLSYPTTPQGTEANIAKVKVDLPKQLPSRLSTLQKACIAATFETNPANCPTGSIIGHATVHTQLLPVPLTGPAYFVSHGGEAFPSLTIVLQGYGLTIDLTGTTLIRKGITSTTFNTTPDVPFNTFELTLPQAKNSALAANGNLCKTTLNMPTLLTAQNNTQIKQTTKITPQNCPKPHHKTTKKHKQHKTKH
jgi:hypothetical protein